MSIQLHNRRAILKAGSTALALPFLESLSVARAAPALAPKRFLMIGCGYGFTKETFFPTKAGRFADIGLTEGLEPLERHRNDITMVSNLTNLGATNAHGGSTSYLTGANVTGTPGKKFHNSISLDQVLAREIGQDTRYPAIALSDKDSNDGHGPGLSLAWSDKGNPIPGITNPVDLYHQLFGQNKESAEEPEFWFINDLDGLSVAVSHGSPWRYDTYVPIIFAGNGIKPQKISRRVHTVDVALTLATAIGTRPPSGAAGEVLLEVLGQKP